MKNIFKNKILSLGICLFLFTVVSAGAFWWYFVSSSSSDEVTREEVVLPPSNEVSFFTIKKNETVYTILREMGFSPKFIHNIIQL